MYEKFQEFLRQVIEDGDWEYGDSTSMTEDVEEVLALLQNQGDLQQRMDKLLESLVAIHYPLHCNKHPNALFYKGACVDCIADGCVVLDNDVIKVDTPNLIISIDYP